MFFAFPLNNKPDWRNPPVLTLLLILINVIIFFGPQRSEEKAWERAAQFYRESRLLAEIEMPRYVEFLRQSGNAEKRQIADVVEKLHQRGEIERPLELMERDSVFQQRLESGSLLPPEDPRYAKWRELRSRYVALKGKPFTARWASNPADWNPASLITSVFLHGSVAHLLGNMLFLFVFGYTVEQTLGARRFLALYLLAGACGDLGDLLARWNSPGLGLGASGAISGLMAAYAVLYGKQRIRFFYQLLFYFDYVKAPAIILLPIWIAHEFLQQWLDGNGGVAYMAHAGGLLGGAALTWWYRRRNPEGTVVTAPAAPPEDKITPLRRKAEAALKEVRLDDACALYRQLTALQPDNREFVASYFNLAKREPGSDHFHRAFRRVMEVPANTDDHPAWLLECYRIYMATAQPPRLNGEQMGKLAFRFARNGHLAEGDRLYRLLAGREPSHQAIPGILLALLTAALKKSGQAAAQDYCDILKAEHATSPEARMAADLLR